MFTIAEKTSSSFHVRRISIASSRIEEAHAEALRSSQRRVVRDEKVNVEGPKAFGRGYVQLVGAFSELSAWRWEGGRWT